MALCAVQPPHIAAGLNFLLAPSYHHLRVGPLDDGKTEPCREKCFSPMNEYDVSCNHVYENQWLIIKSVDFST